MAREEKRLRTTKKTHQKRDGNKKRGEGKKVKKMADREC